MLLLLLLLLYSAYVASFMKHLCEPDTPNSEIYSDGVPKNAVSRQNILTRIGVLKLILNKVLYIVLRT